MNSDRADDFKAKEIVATIEARMTSSRLPGKVLLPAAGKPMLSHLVRRLKAVSSIRRIVLATTVNPADNPLEEFARQNGILCYRGSEDDVMDRVIRAAESARAEIIVQITGDCPIIDPHIVENVIQLFLNNQCKVASNGAIRTFPDGMDVTVFELATLKQSAAMTQDQLDREHVSLHIKNNRDLFPMVHLQSAPETRWPELGLTLDEPDDYALLKLIIEHFAEANPLFSCRDVVDLLRTRPDWLKINSGVVRKGDR